MPVIPDALAALVQLKVNSRMQSVNGLAPLSQKNPAYFIAMCQAIGKGIIMGGPVIAFTTDDSGSEGAPPIPGIGAGLGINPDPTFLVMDLYEKLRGYAIDEFGSTSHDPYPPSQNNSGRYLLALCNGINDAIQEYYPTAWTLVSAHPTIYAGTGTVDNGNFTGLVAPAIQGSIQSLAPTLQGRFWPKLAQAISESYVSLIEQHSTATVTITGICIPGPSQVCGIGATGSGAGTAI